MPSTGCNWLISCRRATIHLKNASTLFCIIGYFFVALLQQLMLYLPRSQINVPRDRHLGNSSHLNVADVVSSFNREEIFLNKPQPAKDVLKRGRAQAALLPGVPRSFDVLTFK